MGEAGKRSEALGIAIKMEKEGQSFYLKAMNLTDDPFVKSMFHSLAEDEMRHAEIFRSMADEVGVKPAALEAIDKEGPTKRISAVFREAARKVREDLKPDDDQIKILDIALGMEQKAYDFYHETAQLCDDPKEKEILGKIANEENEHYRILDDTKLYLTNQAEWNIKEEKPLIDGG